MQEERSRSRLHRILREFLTFLVVVVATLSAKSSLADHYLIPTGSMEPTVHSGDRIIVNKSAYDLRLPFSDNVLLEFDAPTHGDVVVLDSPEQDLLLLKRVVAIPGDRVAVEGGTLRVNGEAVVVRPVGELLLEQLGKEHAILLNRGGGPQLPETIVPPRSFLVLGDNRGDSRDGRIFGMITRSAIQGRAIGVYRSQGEFTWRAL